MKTTAIATTMGFLAFQAVLALPQPSQAPTSQHAGGLIWTGPITKGGEDVTITGTINAIHEEIIKRNPNFGQELGYENEQNSTARLNDIVNPIDWESIECLDPKQGGRTDDVKAAISKIRQWGGRCQFPNSDETWELMECGWDGGVALGNFRNPHTLIVPCSDLADNAEGLVQKCVGQDWRGPFYKDLDWVTSGTIKSFDGSWGVRAEKTWCD